LNTHDANEADELEQVGQLHSLRLALKEKEEECSDLQRELAAFAHSVSHDLRAPLNHIVGFVSLLKDSLGDSLGEEEASYIDTILESSDQLRSQIQALLEYSRLNQAEMYHIEIEFDILVKEAIEQVERSRPHCQVDWHIDAMPLVFGDPTMLRQLLLCLFDNAVKYTRSAEQPRVDMVRLSCEEPGFALFAVKDNGIGFAPAQEKQIFYVFQRLHHIEEKDGLGMGLAKVQRYVHRHGGRIWAHGEPEEGASFYFTLPLYQGEDG
tara:strand:+ start:2251 stop:3048 length:798 start_codon:yes stop_codon:yes gene_type:complete